MEHDFESIQLDRKRLKISKEEERIISEIRSKTTKANRDNISRTNAYERFFIRNPEIKWAFLASMVSRNAGYHMSDLQTKVYKKCFSKEYLHWLFLTLEKGNWLIFEDAYPQLLLFELGKRKKKTLFHLSKCFYISSFMEGEWYYFYKYRDKERLMNALIINEQNMLELGLIKRNEFQRHTFTTLPYILQSIVGASMVLFPTKNGELYGRSVTNFLNVDKRIQLGQGLGKILFHKKLFPLFLNFAKSTEHTGSRNDYIQYKKGVKKIDSPYVRLMYDRVHHIRTIYHDWYNGRIGSSALLFSYDENKKVEDVSDIYHNKVAVIKELMEVEIGMKGLFHRLSLLKMKK